MAGKQKTLNMISGSPMKLILIFALPMMLGNIFQQFYNLVDSIVVGQLVGANALASIGATGSITFLFFALCNGIGSGGGIVTSQYFGSGNTEKVKQCITNVAYIMIIFPLVVSIIAFSLAEPLLVLLETPESLLPDALTYTRIMCVGLVFVSVYNYVSSMLRALGDSRTPLYFLIFSCILNTVLDIVFVKYLSMDVMGAGIATLISQFISGALCIAYAFKTNPYFKLKKEDLRLNREIIADAVKIGLPLSLQFSLIAISSMSLQYVVNTFNETAVAAFTATGRIEQIIHQPYQTLGAALSTFTGQNFGAGKKDRIVKGYRKSLLLMVIFSAVMLPVMQLFGKYIMMIFVDEAPVIEMGADALRINSLFYLFLGVIYVVRGVLNGVGDGFFALLNGIVEVFGRFIVPVVLTGIAAIGVWGIWWSVGIVWFISGFTAWLRYIQVKKRGFRVKRKPQ